MSFLEENKLIYADPNESRERSLANFLKSCTRLDKRLLGDYISRPESLEVLKAFMQLLDFKDVCVWITPVASSRLILCQKPVADAMRDLLETFRLPGESQQIARITETFSEIYFATQPGMHVFLFFYCFIYPTLIAEVKTQDAVYVLAYSIIMLNTDLHNPQVRVGFPG